MKIPQILVPLLFLLLALLPPALDAQQLTPTYLNAVDLAGQGQFPEAKKILQGILAAEPPHEQAAHCLNILEDLEKQKINPETAAHLFKSLSFFYQDKFAEALTESNLALKINPEYKRCYNSRGGAYFGLGENDRAVADFNRALELDPEYAGAYYNRGCVFIKTGQYERAIRDFARALKIDPKFASAAYNRGIAHFQKGEFLWALADFNRAREINPRLAAAHYNRAVILEDLGQDQEAAAAYQQFLQDAPPTLTREISHARQRLEVLQK